MYCVPDDVRNALVPEGDPFDNTAATMQDAQIGDAIATAQSIVEGYASTAYEDDVVPPLIRSLTIDLAAFYATAIYRKQQPFTNNEPILLRQQAAMQTLQDIAAGRVDPNVDVANPPEYAGSVVVENLNGSETFFPMGEFRLGHPGFWRD